MEFIIVLGFCILIIGIGTLFFTAITKKRKTTLTSTTVESSKETLTNQPAEIYLAGGCFWGVQKYFASINGVLSTQVGYANGTLEQPTYELVCEGNTNYAESVRITYDPSIVQLSFLLDMYYKVIDPTSINKQGNDIGTQYRTGIFYMNDSDESIIKESLQQLQKEYAEPLAIEVQPLINYYPAEAYHQDYLDKHPNGYCHISSYKFDDAKNAKPITSTKKPRFIRPSDSDLKEHLSEQQYAVTQQNATEPAYKNAFWNTFDEGIYVDITTGEPLFISTDKFSSECGWPSFSKPIHKQSVVEKNDTSHGMNRIEVRSSIGNSHLGHVFNDGPQHSGGLRYCINSASLKFIPKHQMEEQGYQDYLYLFGSLN